MRKHYRKTLTDTEIQIQNERRIDFEQAVTNHIEKSIACSTSDAQGLAAFESGIISGFHQHWTVPETANHIINQSTPKNAAAKSYSR